MFFVLVGALAVKVELHFYNGGGTPAPAAAGNHARPAGRAGSVPTASPAPSAQQPSSQASTQHGAAVSDQLSNNGKQQQPPSSSAALVRFIGTGSATASNSSALSWQQNVSGSGTALLVAVAVGNSNGDSGLSASVTDNGTAMTALAKVHDDNQAFGFLEVFGLAGAPDGTNTISLTVSGGPSQDLAGGSEAFDGAAGTGTFSAPATAAGNGTSASVTVGSSPGGMVAAFAASGSQFSSTAAPAVQRFIANDDNNTRAGNVDGATSAATGGNATVAWPTWNDFWGTVAVEVN